MTKIAKNYEVARATNLQFLTEFYAKIYEMHYTEVYSKYVQNIIYTNFDL